MDNAKHAYGDAAPVLSVLIPASNEEREIGGCLRHILSSDWNTKSLGPIEVIVIANACRDRTVDIALEQAPEFRELGWHYRVIDREEGGKLGAMNAGDRIAQSGNLVYLDADVLISPGLLAELFASLDVPRARYSSGTMSLARPKSWATKAYARIYQKVPFLTQGVPGCGLFAVNAMGRTRWGEFPDIISDDTFVRLNFTQGERVAVAANYTWPLVEGWKNLVKVRRRQNAGVDEIVELYPELTANDDKPPFPFKDKLKMAVSDPIGFAVYAGVALVVKMTPGSRTSWSRGR